ncbi:MAG: helix-turn-helix domain-containing protein [Firmicutes bacterium]|jgi:excisionase family DNA binding protein|nr:helix-turn-helix domain-containing protein [Bacillota bacterium]MCL5012830.1 helix-turn-helix domain-containing protein [Bacillota bacterium]
MVSKVRGKPINPEQKYVSPRQAARLLGVSEFLIYREVAAGHIPHRKIGSRILIPMSWIEEANGEAI